MAVGDIYYISLFGTINSQQTLNQFWFRQESGVAGAEELALEFRNSILTAWRGVVSSVWNTSSLKCYNWDDPLDFIEDTYAPLAGLLSGNCQAPYIAFGLFQPRKRTDMRQGSKRIAGVFTNAAFNGVITDGAVLSGMATLCAAMSDPVVSTDPAGSWQQIIVRRVNTGTPTNPVYEVPSPITVNDYYTADSWQFKLQVTTQNTRKIGRGA